MKNFAKIMFMISVSSVASAQELVEMPLGFLSQDQAFQANTIYTSSGLLTEQEWVSQAEASLELAPGFRSLQNLDPVSGEQNLEVFQSEVAFVVDTKSALTYFSQKPAVEILASVDPGFSHAVISSVEANEIYQAELNESFAGARRTLEQRLLRSREPIDESTHQKASAVLQEQLALNQSAQWCEAAGSVCVRSQAKIEGTWEGLFEMLQAFPSESLLQVPTEISLLAEVTSQASGKPSDGESDLLVIRGFWANALIQFYTLSIQIRPLKGNQSVLSLRSVVAFERDDLDKLENSFFSARSLLLGRSIYNGDVGFSMGLPLIQVEMANRLSQDLKRKN